MERCLLPADVLQWEILFVRILHHKSGMTVGKGSTLGILAAKPHLVTFLQ